MRSPYRSRMASATSQRSVSPSASMDSSQSMSAAGAPTPSRKRSPQARNGPVRSSRVLSRSSRSSGTRAPYGTDGARADRPGGADLGVDQPRSAARAAPGRRGRSTQHACAPPGWPRSAAGSSVGDQHVLAGVGAAGQRPALRVVDRRAAVEPPRVGAADGVGEHHVHRVVQRAGGVVEVAAVRRAGQVAARAEVAVRAVGRRRPGRARGSSRRSRCPGRAASRRPAGWRPRRPGVEQLPLAAPELLLVVRRAATRRRGRRPATEMVRRPSGCRTAAPTTTTAPRVAGGGPQRVEPRRRRPGRPRRRPRRCRPGRRASVGGWYAGRNSSGSTTTRAPRAARPTSRAAVAALPATSPGTGSAWTAATVSGCGGEGRWRRCHRAIVTGIGRPADRSPRRTPDCHKPYVRFASAGGTCHDRRRAQSKSGPARRAPAGDPRRRAGVFRPARLRGRHRAPAGGGHRALPGRDLPPLPGQGLALPRGRRGRRRRHGGDGRPQRPGPGHAGPAGPGRLARTPPAGWAASWRSPGGCAPTRRSPGAGRNGPPPSPRPPGSGWPASGRPACSARTCRSTCWPSSWSWPTTAWCCTWRWAARPATWAGARPGRGGRPPPLTAAPRARYSVR